MIKEGQEENNEKDIKRIDNASGSEYGNVFKSFMEDNYSISTDDLTDSTKLLRGTPGEYASLSWISTLLDESNEKIKKQESRTEKIEKDQEKMKEEIASAQTKMIETVGIFVALFTFISVNVQIFSNVTNLFSAAMFSIILAALIGIMILVFLLVLSPYKKEEKWKKIFCGLLMIFIFFIIVGLVGIFFSEFRLNQDTFANNSNNDKMSAEVKIK